MIHLNPSISILFASFVFLHVIKVIFGFEISHVPTTTKFMTHVIKIHAQLTCLYLTCTRLSLAIQRVALYSFPLHQLGFFRTRFTFKIQNKHLFVFKIDFHYQIFMIYNVNFLIMKWKMRKWIKIHSLNFWGNDTGIFIFDRCVRISRTKSNRRGSNFLWQSTSYAQLKVMF